MTLDDLERQNRGFLSIFWPLSPVRVYIIHAADATPAYGRSVLWSRWVESK